MIKSAPKMLDLFCGAGGASMGYHRAGFDVCGVDIDPQPHYPFKFVQADALSYLAEHWREYDAFHASPPCQKFTTLQNVNRARGLDNDHPDFIEATRRVLIATGKPYVIENVQGAPLLMQIIICGHSVGLPRLARHRHFESNILLFSTPCTHRGKDSVGVYGLRPDGHRVSPRGQKLTRVASSITEARDAMGIDWMDWHELKEAIPPAYTEFIGRQILPAA
jgi:DNA (cytosine-5)-methyltransferase 1